MADINLRPRQEDGFLFLSNAFEHGHEPLAGLAAFTGYGKSITHQVLATHLVNRGVVRLTVTLGPELVIERSLAPHKADDGTDKTYHFLKHKCTPITVDTSRWRVLRDVTASGKEALRNALREGLPEYTHLVTTYQAMQSWMRDPDFLPKDLRDTQWFPDEGHHISEDNGIGEVIQEILARGGNICPMTATMFRHTGKLLFDTTQVPVFSYSLAEAMSEPDESRFCPRELRLSMKVVPKGENLPPFVVGILKTDKPPKSIIRLKSGRSAEAAADLKTLISKELPHLRVRILIGPLSDEDTKLLDHERKVKRYCDSQVDVLLVCGRFLEGGDWPLCSHIYNLDSTQSLVRIIQSNGRAMRDKKGIEDYPEEWVEVSVATQILQAAISEDDFRGHHLDRTFIIATMVANNHIGLNYLRDDLRGCLETPRGQHSGHPNPDQWTNVANELNFTEEELKQSLTEIAKTDLFLQGQGLRPKQITAGVLANKLQEMYPDPEDFQRHKRAVSLYVGHKSRVVQDYVRRKVRELLGNPKAQDWRWVRASLQDIFSSVVDEFEDEVVTDLITSNENGPSVMDMVTEVTGLRSLEIGRRLETALPWEGWFHKLKEFQATHSHLNVHTEDDHQALAAWLDRQVAAYRHNELLPERQKQLQDLGVTLVRTYSTADMLAELIRDCRAVPEWIPVSGDPLGDLAKKLRIDTTDLRREQVTKAVPKFEWDNDFAEFRAKLQNHSAEILTPGTKHCAWYESFYLSRRLGLPVSPMKPHVYSKFTATNLVFQDDWDALDDAYEEIHREWTRQRVTTFRQQPTLALQGCLLWPTGFLGERVFGDKLLDYEREALLQDPLPLELRTFLSEGTQGKGYAAMAGIYRNQKGEMQPGGFLDLWWRILTLAQQNELRSRL